MPDWVACPQCGLKHSARPDGLCPRCSNAVGAAPQPLSGADAAEVGEALRVAPADRPARLSDATTGSRVAGGVLLVNAALTGLFLAKGHSEVLVSPAGIVFDAVVGGSLAMGKPKSRHIGLVRLALGALIFGGMFAAKGDYLSMGVQLVFSSALALLIAGTPGAPRIGLGATMAGGCLALAAIGLFGESTGTHPLAAAILRSKGEIAPAAGRIRGTKLGYCLDAPRSGWYLRSAEAAHRDNAGADRWLTRPDLDAHLMVIAEDVGPGKVVNPKKLEEIVVNEMKERLTGYQLLDRKSLPAGTVLHIAGRGKALDLEYYRALFVDGSRAFQVVAFATPRSFASSAAELDEMVRSFQPACAITP